MAVFVGEFEQVIDAKHRIAVSAALREQLDLEQDGGNFYLLLGPDRHLWLYPDKFYRRLLSTLRPSPLPDRETKKFDIFFATARYVKPDAQGRVVLPEVSMRRATISERVTLVGKLDHIEIWPTEEWDRHVEELMPSYSETLYEAGERLNRSAQRADDETRAGAS